MSRKLIFQLSIATLIGFSIIGCLIVDIFLDQSIVDSLRGNSPWYYQIFLGSIYGFVVALLGWKIIELPFLKSTKVFFTNLIQPLRLNFSEILFISFCAGVGEEILFRGAIQPFFGVLITAIIFVAIHGYLNPFNWRISIYGIFMTVAIAGIGFMTNYFGLLSSVMAHIVVDIILLFKLSRTDTIEIIK